MTPKEIIAKIGERVLDKPGHNMLAHEIIKKLAAEGYVIVPKEATYSMLEAGRDADRANEKETLRRIEEEDRLTWRTENVGKVWAAMIAATDR